MRTDDPAKITVPKTCPNMVKPSINPESSLAEASAASRPGSAKKGRPAVRPGHSKAGRHLYGTCVSRDRNASNSASRGVCAKSTLLRQYCAVV